MVRSASKRAAAKAKVEANPDPSATPEYQPLRSQPSIVTQAEPPAGALAKDSSSEDQSVNFGFVSVSTSIPSTPDVPDPRKRLDYSSRFKNLGNQGDHKSPEEIKKSAIRELDFYYGVHPVHLKPGAQEPRRSGYMVPARDIISTAPEVFDQRRLPSFGMPLPTIVKHVPWEFPSDDVISKNVYNAGSESAPIEQVNTALNFATKSDLNINVNNNSNIINPNPNFIPSNFSNSTQRAHGENSGSANQNPDPLPRGYAYQNSDQAIRGTLDLLQDMINAPSGLTNSHREFLIQEFMKAYDLKKADADLASQERSPAQEVDPPPQYEVPMQSAHVLRPEVDYGTWRMKSGSHAELYQYITRMSELRHQYPYAIVDSRRLIDASLVVSMSVAFNNIRAMYKTHHDSSYSYTDYNAHDWYKHSPELVKDIVINYCRSITPESFVKNFVEFIQQDQPHGHELTVASYNEFFHPYFTACMNKYGFIYKKFYYCPITHRLWSDMPSTPYTQLYKRILPPISIGTRDAPGLGEWMFHAWGPYKDKICNWCGRWSVVKTLKTYDDFRVHLNKNFGDLALTSLQGAANNVRIEGVPTIPKVDDSRYFFGPKTDAMSLKPSRGLNPGPVYTTQSKTSISTPRYSRAYTTPKQSSSVSDISTSTKATGFTPRALFQPYANRVLSALSEETESYSSDAEHHPDGTESAYTDADTPPSEVSSATLNEAYSLQLGAMLPDKTSAITETFRGFCANIICFGKCENPTLCRFDHSSAGRELCQKSLDLLRQGRLQEHTQLPYCTLPVPKPSTGSA